MNATPTKSGGGAVDIINFVPWKMTWSDHLGSPPLEKGRLAVKMTMEEFLAQVKKFGKITSEEIEYSTMRYVK